MRFQPHFPLYFLLLTSLASCQGTGFGGIVESAIAPKPAQTESITLPTDFPADIPIFRQASLQDLQRSPQTDSLNVTSRWLIREQPTQVTQFYRDALSQNGWQVLRSSDLVNQTPNQGTFLAERNDLLVTVAVQPIPEGTSLLLQYVRLPQPVANNTPNNLSSNLNQLSNNFSRNTIDVTNFSIRLFGLTRSFPRLNGQSNSQTNSQILSQNLTSFLPSDLEAAPASLRPFVKDISQLGIIAPKSQNNFEPNRTISRREYARWLAMTNNRIYQNRPSRQIRLAQAASDAPTFTDVPRNDPDFSIIQGLANAGLIRPSADTTNNTANLFRPDAQISREELLQWKVPLDLRRPLPNATVESVSQAWGFQDSDRIAPTALRAILADAQAGDLSNIRRSFGFTTLFQPQKPVTRAEAAAILWYFGTQTDGLSIQNILEIEKATTNPSNPSSNNTSVIPSPNPSLSPTPSSTVR
ncbi:S-layer homology domain-containing protein [Tumidithrix elongata RA019]|uniref:S-layer homology domain-containing protein n=1 Tax=Tumidithrix elongata BACA0141 TaxID=2716417 RepID=A0AAW9PZE3_9CYAN|nr:S-layer homology domain-containing protein [Tumidithrix elongata RA019]